MKQQTKNRLKAIYIIYVLVMFVLFMGNAFGGCPSTDDKVMFVFYLVAPIPIYYAVHFWTKTPQ